MQRDPRYHDRIKAQTLAWAQGRPYHEPTDDECCPDFSCCHRDLFTEDEVERWRYYHDQFGGRH